MSRSTRRRNAALTDGANDGRTNENKTHDHRSSVIGIVG
jgi:hypothetical protein